MKKTEKITRDILGYINFKFKEKKCNKEIKLLKDYISKSDLFNGDKKKLYKLINSQKNK